MERILIGSGVRPGATGQAIQIGAYFKEEESNGLEGKVESDSQLKNVPDTFLPPVFLNEE